LYHCAGQDAGAKMVYRRAKRDIITRAVKEQVNA
jgi:hypothetical protein